MKVIMSPKQVSSLNVVRKIKHLYSYSDHTGFRTVYIVTLPEKLENRVDSSSPSYSLLATFISYLEKVEDDSHRLMVADEFFKLYLRAITVTDCKHSPFPFVNQYEEKVLNDLIEAINLTSDFTAEINVESTFNELPIGKVAILQDDLYVLKKHSLLILFEAAMFEKGERDLMELIGLTNSLISVFLSMYEQK
jgi:hypothetical protein